MADLWLPGLATGIDTKSIVAQLMVIEAQRLARYQVKKAGYEEQETAFTALRSKISATKTAVSALSDADDLQIFATTSSDTDILTVSSSSDANPGSHSIEIDQLATGETWIQDTSTFSYETDYVGGGSFIYSYNHIERVITAVAGETTLEDFVGLITVADETTLEDFVGLINNDVENPGVTANLLYQGGKYHLMLSGEQTGEDYQISVNASTTEVWASSTEGGSFTKDGEVAGLTTINRGRLIY
jgi:flagellar hook-associated protein 2